MRVFLFTHSKKPFTALLQEEGVEFIELAPPVGVVMASGWPIEIPLVAAGMHLLVKVILAYLKARQSRKVIITTKDGVFTFHAEGLSQSELEKTLRLAQNVSVVDTRGEGA